MRRSAALLTLAALSFLLVLMTAAAARAETVIETYTDPAAFTARLAGAAFPVKTVNFDDIKGTTTTNAVSFPVTQYTATTGMIITGEDGQFASQGFTWPDDFVPVSPPNTYSPGPEAWSGPTGAGGNNTDVTFSAGSGAILAAGFGCYFIDADYPGQGPSSFAVCDGSDASLGDTGVVVTPDAGQAFRGIVTVDSVSGAPVAAIARVHIVNGDGWPSWDDGEGCVLDDFMAGTATYTVSGKVVRRSGRPFKGVRVTLKGSFTTKLKTNVKGRYAFDNVPSGTYKVTPKKPGFTFKPVRRTAKVGAATLKLARFRANR